MSKRGIYVSLESNRRTQIQQLLVEAAHELSLGNDVDAWIACALALHKMAELDESQEILEKAIAVLRQSGKPKP